MRRACHLIGEAVADVSCESCIDSCACEDMVYQHCGGRLAVAACDAYHLGVGVASGEFDFTDNMYVFCHGGLYHRCIKGYAGAFHDFIGRQNLVHRVRAFLERNALVLKNGAIFGRDSSRIAQKHVETFVLCQYGGSRAAFTGTEHYETSFCCVHYLIFNVTNVIAASIMPMIQNRVTILDSGMAWRGRCIRASIPALPSFWK